MVRKFLVLLDAYLPSYNFFPSILALTSHATDPLPHVRLSKMTGIINSSFRVATWPRHCVLYYIVLLNAHNNLVKKD
jgi:hypothetical protein